MLESDAVQLCLSEVLCFEIEGTTKEMNYSIGNIQNNIYIIFFLDDGGELQLHFKLGIYS